MLFKLSRSTAAALSAVCLQCFVPGTSARASDMPSPPAMPLSHAGGGGTSGVAHPAPHLGAVAAQDSAQAELQPRQLLVSAYYAPMTAQRAAFGFGGQVTSPTLARLQYDWHNGRGAHYAFGAGSTEASFFGLEPSGHAPISLSGERSRFAAPYFSLADNASHIGYARSLRGGAVVRVGSVVEVPVEAAPLAGDPAAAPVAPLVAGRSMSVIEWQQQSGKVTGVLTLGHMRESNAALGIRGTGALAIGARPATTFVALAGSTVLSANTAVSLMASVGRTRAFDNRAVSVIDGASTTRSAAWSLGLSRNDLLRSGDSLGLSVSMPLKIRSGALRVTTAVAQNQDDGSLVYETRMLSLRPTGTQKDIELSYARPVASGGTMAVLATARFQPGHDGTAATQLALGARYVRAF